MSTVGFLQCIGDLPDACTTARGLDWLARDQNADGSWDGDVGYKRNESYVTTREQGSAGAEGEGEHLADPGGGELPRDDGHRPAAVDLVVDDGRRRHGPGWAPCSTGIRWAIQSRWGCPSCGPGSRRSMRAGTGST